MIRIFLITLLLCFVTIVTALSQENVVDLDLHKVYFVEGPENFQPSGLTIINGRLYTVSDKHDNFIYSLELTDDIAKAIPAVEIPLPLFSFIYSYDFEGITHDKSANFYLASETQCRILRVSPDGKNGNWMTPDLKPAGKKVGLFQTKNAYLEAICYISFDEFILCAERQRRGFLEVNLGEKPIKFDAYPSEKSIFKFPDGTNNDFSGLCLFRNNIYVLERNAYLFCKLKRENAQLLETTGWSYRHVETAEPFRYADMKFGKAEGLCIDDQKIYIIIDNNNDHRFINPEDRRPILMLFNHPENF